MGRSPRRLLAGGVNGELLPVWARWQTMPSSMAMNLHAWIMAVSAGTATTGRPSTAFSCSNHHPLTGDDPSPQQRTATIEGATIEAAEMAAWRWR
jgi:hypothetical protein